MPLYKRAPKAHALAKTLMLDGRFNLRGLVSENIIVLEAFDLKGDKANHYGEVKKLSGLLALALDEQLGDPLPEKDHVGAARNPGDYEGFLIILNGDLWRAIAGVHESDDADVLREQIMHHFLLSCEIEVDDNGNVKRSVAKPDIALFREEIAIFGCALPHVKAVLRAVETHNTGQIALFESGDLSTEDSALVENLVGNGDADFEEDDPSALAAIRKRQAAREYGATEADLGIPVPAGRA